MSLPTNVATDTGIEHFQPLISLNEIGRQVSCSMREERQSKVDAFAAMLKAGERSFVSKLSLRVHPKRRLLS